MSSNAAEELCRLSVIGPAGRADLAVPQSTALSALLPILVRHAVDGGALGDVTLPSEATALTSSWVLQRLGGNPLDPDGTAETLDLLDGEELYLRPAADPLPALDFDDLADGIATVMEERPDRWRPEFGRHLFLALCGLLAVVIALLLLDRGPAATQAGSAAGVCVVAGFGAVLAGRHLRGFTGLVVLAGLACCGFGGLGGMIAADAGPGGAGKTASGLLVGSTAMAVCGVALLVSRKLGAHGIPFAPFVSVVLVDVGAMVWVWLDQGFGLTPSGAAGVLAAIFLAALIFAPKLVLRAAHMRGPQLPRNAADLQFDIEPSPAELVQDRTVAADQYLSAGAAAASAVFITADVLVLHQHDWPELTLVALLSVAALLRARTFLSLWQRISLVVAGSIGLVLVLLIFAQATSQQWRGLLLLGLLGLMYPLVQAVLRAPLRRPLPVWGYLANVADTLVAIALLPVLLDMLGVYGWAHGLVG